MPETAIAEGNGSRLSKYARKKRDRSLGLRSDFQFIDGGLDSPSVTIKADTPVAETVQGIVTEIISDRGCAFLTLSDLRRVYLVFNRIKKDLGMHILRKGQEFECEIEPHPNGKGLRVRKILRVCRQ